MFDIGFLELVLVNVVALIVLGPERFPYAIRAVSKWVEQIRKSAARFKDEITSDLDLKNESIDLVGVEDKTKIITESFYSNINTLNEDAILISKDIIELTDMSTYSRTTTQVVVDSHNSKMNCENIGDQQNLIGRGNEI